MADRFYSIHPDESAFINFSACRQSSAVGISGNLIGAPVSLDSSSDLNYFAPSIDSNRSSSSLRFTNQGQFGKISSNSSCGSLPKYNGHNYILQNTGGFQSMGIHQGPPSACNYAPSAGFSFGRNRYTPYSHNRSCTPGSSLQFQQSQFGPSYPGASNFERAGLSSEFSYANMGSTPAPITNTTNNNAVVNCSSKLTTPSSQFASADPNQNVTLQISNLDYSLDESSLRNFLLNQLKPITPVVSMVFESSSYAKVTVPDLHFAKQVVANLHRKKIGHKRMIVSYTRDSSLTEINTLRCQVAGLLKDVPYCTLPMYKFRELFQSRFKTSISVLDLYKMQDICTITTDQNEDKFISLHQDLINSIETSPLMEGLQHSVPYCTIHFKREQHKGWAEQDIEPLPNVCMTIAEIQQIIYPLLKTHPGDIPVSSLVHCIEGQLNIQINRNENGVNLEHLICCVHGIQITMNNFGIKILGWLEPENAVGKETGDGRLYTKNGVISDPLYQISREVVELVKMSPKSTMKFNRFIPAYHNHFGKQCRVADYGYTKLIELFEALSSVVQIMGDGENRQITLTHRTQIRRFTSDLLRILRAQANKSVLLSQLPKIFTQTQNKSFDITDYGICNVVDILDGLVNSNIVVLTTIQNGKDMVISIPKRKQTSAEVEKTCVFAGEVVELFRNAPQYSISFQKFVRSYHYHFGYQCRLSDYGFLKLADLMEAIQGVVEIELTNDEDKKIYLSPKVAQRVFAEQLEELIRSFTGSPKTCMKLDEVLQLHKKKYGYQIQHQTLGVERILDAVKILPYVEILETDDIIWIICHNDDAVFHSQCYRSCRIIQDHGCSKEQILSMNEFINLYAKQYNETLSENTIAAMKHAIEIIQQNDTKYVAITKLMKFLIRIVRILEQRSMSLADIKSTLNIGIGYCFEFGYPNLFTLFRAFPDIFVVSNALSQERSEISLVPQNELSQYCSQTCGNPQKAQSKKRQALVECNRPAKIANSRSDDSSSSDLNCRHLSSVQNAKGSRSLPLNGSLSSTSLSSSLSHNSSKENSFNCSASGMLSGELNSSATSEMNTSAISLGSVNANSTGFNGGLPKLWDRRQAVAASTSIETTNYYNNVTDKSSVHLNFSENCLPICSYFEQPQPDTPSDNMPFWINPIWKNRNAKKKQKMESLNIKLPDIKTFNILPMLMSPYTLSKTENMKKMFLFDNIGDKNIA